MSSPTDSGPHVQIARSDAGALRVQVRGEWRVRRDIPAATPVRDAIAAERPACVVFDSAGVVAWDSALVAYTSQIDAAAAEAGVAVDRSGLPRGVQRLLALAEATPRRPATPASPRPSAVARLGTRALSRGAAATAVVRWAGELAIAFARLASGRARFRQAALFLQMQLAGARALGIVSLVAGLVGLILAFVGAVQLQRFGATIYVADLVGVAMVREIGAVMAAIVVAGRTGAAFAAELGTMRVTEELDALRTLGISPVELLVLPRVIAVTLMLPLLCIYADLVGLIGGAVVGVGLMDISPRHYFDETVAAVSVGDVAGGVVKSSVYGLLIASAACFEGMRSGKSAASVGKAATAAVVDGIVLVIAACGGFAVLFYVLGL